MERMLYGYVIPFAMAFLLLAVGIYFVLESLPTLLDISRGALTVQQSETEASQLVFKDVLQTVLALAAVAIAAFGYGTYRILSSQIEERVQKGIEARYQKSLAYHRAALGYMNWILYKNAEHRSGIAKTYLDESIRHTRVAYDENAVNLDARETEYEHLICQIRNNLAFFMSEKHKEFGPLSELEKAECLSFVNWLEARIDNHPTDAHEYRDTIDTVRECCATSD